MRILLLTLSVLLPLGLISSPRIERIEPLHWWVGMHNPELQLLVYGESIGALQPRIRHSGVAIRQTIRVPNPNYLFIDLSLAPDTPAGSIEIEFLDDETVVQSIAYTLLEREAGSAQRVGFDASDVMYLITPDRFVNGDPSNDAIAGMKERPDRSNMDGRHGGDLQGIIDSLEYLDEMGFTAIWVNPVLENDMPLYSYHGYAATDFYQVDRRFGSNGQYRELIDLAKKRGIKVIMDMILNHCGSEHWFVKDPPTPDWINFEGRYSNTSHRRTTVQDIHAAEVDRRQFSDGWFVETMPDLNQRNPLMATYLIQNSIWWIESTALAGIRMDTYPYPDKQFMADWTCALMAEYPNLNIVGEEWSLNPAIVAYWQKGKTNHDGYTSCLRSLMDFPLQGALTEALTDPEGRWDEGLVKLYEAVAMDFLYADASELVIFPDNHDMDRFFTQVDGDLDLLKMGLAFYLTMRGVPQIYYGTEVLMENDGAPGDHGVIRTGFPGGWAGDTVNAMTGEGLNAAQKENQAYLQKLLRWRQASPAIHHGRLMHYAPEAGAYVYFRYTEEDTVMVVLNKNETPVDLAISRFSERLGGFATGLDVITGDSHALGEVLRVPGRAALILELE